MANKYFDQHGLEISVGSPAPSVYSYSTPTDITIDPDPSWSLILAYTLTTTIDNAYLVLLVDGDAPTWTAGTLTWKFADVTGDVPVYVTRQKPVRSFAGVLVLPTTYPAGTSVSLEVSANASDGSGTLSQKASIVISESLVILT